MRPTQTLLLLLLLLLTGCRAAAPATAPASEVSPFLAEASPLPPRPLPSATPTSPPPVTPTETPLPALPETAVTLLPLDGPAAARKAEYSGMAWCGEWLILLPQYPDRFAVQTEGADGALFALSKADILAALESDPPPALTPRVVPLQWDDLPRQVRGFEGFEALACEGETAYLTIEASPGGSMKGYLVRGAFPADLSGLQVDLSSLTEIPLPADISNKSDEALLLLPEGGVAAFYEVNGAQVNPAPVVQVFSSEMTLSASLSFPALEYRLTDVSALDSEEIFWGINYFYPGDAELRPETDPLAERYGLGESHVPGGPVERLVAFRWTDDGVTLVEQPPLYLRLLPDGEARNWEGLARLDDLGFLLVTDKYPETLLGFVPLR